MASHKNGALYIGITGDLKRRVWEHKKGIGYRHVRGYNIFKLVYYAEFPNINEAIDDEKRMKAWLKSYNFAWWLIFMLLDKMSAGGFNVGSSRERDYA